MVYPICFNLMNGTKVMLPIDNACSPSPEWLGFQFLGENYFLPRTSACWVMYLKEVDSTACHLGPPESQQPMANSRRLPPSHIPNSHTGP